MKLFIALTFSLFCSTASAANTNTFESTTLGFSITKPNNWHFLTANQHFENLKSLKLNDQDFQKRIQEHSNSPLVVMTKHLEPFDDLNPSLKVSVKPIGQLKGHDARIIMELYTKQLQNFFEQFEMIQSPILVDLAGNKAAYARFNYQLQTQTGQTFPTTSEIWIVPSDNFFYLIGSGTRQDEATGNRSEIANILKTLVL